MPVRADRNQARLNACFPSCLNSICGAAKAAGSAGGDIDAAAGFSKFQGFLKHIWVASTVCRTNMADRETAFDDFFINFKGPVDVAGMNVKNANLACDHASDSNISEQMKDLFDCWERRTMVA